MKVRMRACWLMMRRIDGHVAPLFVRGWTCAHCSIMIPHYMNSAMIQMHDGDAPIKES